MRTAFDFSPLYASMIGVDRMAEMIDASMKSGGDRAYPPYDIEKTGDDAYRITIATAGFTPKELEIIAQPNLLVVAGRKAEPTDGRQFLHHGLAGRNFEHQFELADYVVVRAADYAHGLLSIDLAREVPEALKPRRVEIATWGGGRQIQDDRRARRAA
ncbi:MAG: Hsp20 family protein [Alphaproteobacteria bacterium]|nr:Hsp20 family protein [Alphaproteobacteria bacterium]MBU1516670.1 Hsp20 family protein [Alphaproteobacteria bacterium]MBU2094426.1 Hsp20 family protein [Alphaproteobacteria bacterium]MBU2152653.1 Hsp20 family protein [Alphaproteobacteria bacterium]MBU2306145.1 Hsp20 family protein [Alphaproteobacteria bacterium]